MENRQNKPPEGEAASGHGGQKFYTDSEQAKLHKSKLRMESREERLNKARERLAKQKPPKSPAPSSGSPGSPDMKPMLFCMERYIRRSATM